MATSDHADEMQACVRRQEAIAELGRRALEDGDLDSLLCDVVDAVGDTLDADYCDVLERLPGGEELFLRQGVGWQDGVVGNATVPTDSDSRSGRALVSEGPVVEDGEAESQFSSLDVLVDHGVESGVSVVIGSVDDPWGVLGVHATDRRSFADHEVAFVRSVANLLASAIDDERTRRTLREEAELKDRIVETSPVGITVVRPDGEVEFANERAEELLGREREEITSMAYDDPGWDLVDTDDTPLTAEQMPFRRVMDAEESIHDVEFGIRRASGRRVWLSLDGEPLWNDAGRVTGAVFTIEDVTERKRLEGELETTFSRITDAFFGLDTDWRFTYVNERAEELIDPEGTGLVGETVWETFPAAVDSTFETEYRRAMKRQEPASFEEYFPPLETWFEVHAYPSETGLSVYFQDVTERKETERELRESNRTIQRLYAITADRERSFDEKVRDLLDLGRERLGVDVGYLATIDEEADHFEIVHASGNDERLQPGSVEALSNTYCRRTIDADGLLVLENAPAEGWDDDHAYEKWGFDCYLGGKVLVDGELYGTLCFEDRRPHPSSFTEAERTFVELATQWVSYELERERRKREIEESERRYRTLVEHFPNGVVGLFDEELQYTLGGGRILAELGVGAEELVGQSIWERYPEHVAAELEPRYRAALAGERNSFEVEFHDRHWSVYTLPVRDDDGTVFAGMMMGQDVTEHRKREQQLRERERRLERYREYTDDVLDAIDDIFYILDESGDIQRWNESVCEVTGYSDAEIESMHGLEFIAEDDREAVANTIAEVFRTGSGRIEASALTEDGETIPYELVASSLETPAGESVLTGIGRDISEREENRRRLEETIEKLEESNERLEQFAYAASHDLQEPLRMVSSYLTLVERRYADELDDDGREFIEFAVDGADRMREMIDGLLAYSRIETRGDPFEPVALEEVLEEAIQDLQVTIEETDAEITTEELPGVRGDESQLRQLFENLVNNAIKYVEDEPPRVHVSSERAGDEWRISVSDNGIGIDPDDAERIFTVFQRLHGLEEYSGAGIGLALCQRIVERHGGEIWADSEPGEGSTFTFTLSAEETP